MMWEIFVLFILLMSF